MLLFGVFGPSSTQKSVQEQLVLNLFVQKKIQSVATKKQGCGLSLKCTKDQRMYILSDANHAKTWLWTKPQSNISEKKETSLNLSQPNGSSDIQFDLSFSAQIKNHNIEIIPVETQLDLFNAKSPKQICISTEFQHYPRTDSSNETMKTTISTLEELFKNAGSPFQEMFKVQQSFNVEESEFESGDFNIKIFVLFDRVFILIKNESFLNAKVANEFAKFVFPNDNIIFSSKEYGTDELRQLFGLLGKT